MKYIEHIEIYWTNNSCVVEENYFFGSICKMYNLLNVLIQYHFQSLYSPVLIIMLIMLFLHVIFFYRVMQ